MMFISLGLGALLAIALITVVSLATGGKVTTGDPVLPTSNLTGQHVKAFHLPGLGGGEVSAPWASGHPAVVIVFASYCGPCQGEMPKVAHYLNTHSTGDVRVIGVDASDTTSAGAAFVARSHVRFAVGADPNDTVATTLFGFQSIPDTVFVNARGVVTNVYLGAIPETTLAAGIRSLEAKGAGR